jgi:hypothetical protein
MKKFRPAFYPLYSLNMYHIENYEVTDLNNVDVISRTYFKSILS